MRLLAAVAALALMMALLLACEDEILPDGTPGANGILDNIIATATPTMGAGQPGTDGEQVAVSLEDPGGSGEYQFDPAEFTFSVGDTVTFALTAETELHTFTVEELGIDVEVPAMETEQYTHTFDQAGTFALICIPHEFQGMVGTITVQ